MKKPTAKQAAEIEKNVRLKVASLSTLEIVEAYDLTQSKLDNPNIPTVRGWLIDELEKRDGEAFLNWLINSHDGSPRAFFIKS